MATDEGEHCNDYKFALVLGVEVVLNRIDFLEVGGSCEMYECEVKEIGGCSGNPEVEVTPEVIFNELGLVDVLIEIFLELVFAITHYV